MLRIAFKLTFFCVCFLQFNTAEAAALDLARKRGEIEKKEIAMKYLAILNRMRMAATHTKMVSGLKQMLKPQVIAQLSDVSTKMKRAVEIVGGLMSEGKKVVIFSQWVKFLNALEPLMMNQLKLGKFVFCCGRLLTFVVLFHIFSNRRQTHTLSCTHF